MSSIDQQFVEFAVKSIVNHPDDVVIERTIDEKGVLIMLTVNPEDLGRVIGKRGATAQSLRTLLRALGTKNEARYNLKIVDNGEPRPEREDRDEKPAKDDKPAEDDDGDDAADEPADEPTEEAKEEKDEEEEEKKLDDAAESLADRTMKELEDLDDLDI